MGQILTLYAAINLGRYFTQILSFIQGQYLTQIKFQIVAQIGHVDATLGLWPETSVHLAHRHLKYYICPTEAIVETASKTRQNAHMMHHDPTTFLHHALIHYLPS